LASFSADNPVLIGFLAYKLIKHRMRINWSRKHITNQGENYIKYLFSK